MKSMINWFSIPSADFDRAVKFYNTIFDISMKVMDDGKSPAMATFFENMDNTISGGVSADPLFKPTSDGVRIYLRAEGNIDEILGRVEAAGGKVLQAKESMGEYGFWGLFEDSEGNHIGLHSES